MGILVVDPGEERSLAFPHELHGFLGQLGGLVVFMVSLHLEGTERLLVIGMIIVVAQTNLVNSVPHLAQFVVGEEMVFSEHPGSIAAFLQRRYEVGNTRVNGRPVVAATMLADVGTCGETDPARGTKRGLAIAILETNTLAGKTIYMPGFDRRMTVATKIVRS